MKIALASQNRREITDHAGQCRRFWVVDVTDRHVGERVLVELDRDQTFHATGTGLPVVLEGIAMLVAGSMGPGLRQRLAARGIVAIVTSQRDIEAVLALAVAGTLVDEPAAGRHDGAHDCGCAHPH